MEQAKTKTPHMLEQVNTTKIKSKTGSWNIPAEEVVHDYLTDMETTLRTAGNTLKIQKREGRKVTTHDLIGHTS